MSISREWRINRRHFLQTTVISGLALSVDSPPVMAQDELLINTTTLGLQHQPVITGIFLPRHFVVVWADRSDANIKGQILTETGERIKGEFIINSSTTTNTDRHRPAISGIPGGFVVAWIEQPFNVPGPRPHVHLQMFDDSGRSTGPQVQVSTTDVDPEHRPSITSMIDGGFVVTWADARPDQRIRAQRFGFGGSRTGPEFRVDSTEGFHRAPIITRLVDGNYVIAWRSDPNPPGGGALVLRIFDLEGSPMGGEIKPDLSGFTGEKAMTLLDNGRFVIAHVRSQGTSDLGVQKSSVECNVFELTGASSNIGLSATSGQGINSSWPALAPLPGGRFLVAWAQKSAETFATSTSIRAKVFSDSQGSVGQEVQANTATAGDRFNVCTATVFGDGGESAFVAWSDSSQAGGDPSDFAVRWRPLPVLPSGGLG